MSLTWISSSRLYLEAYGILLAICDELVHLFLRKGKQCLHLHAGVGVVLEILDFSTLGLPIPQEYQKRCVGLAIVEKLLYIFLIRVSRRCASDGKDHAHHRSSRPHQT